MPTISAIAKKIQAEIDDYIHKKDSLDSIVSLSKDKKEKEYMSVDKVENSEGYMTLLSEGSVLYKDGTIRLYITKGTLSKWYNSLGADYEGYVTTGHVSLDSFPVRDGYFRKEDLKLVTDKHGRSDLLVKPHVNLELSNVKDLVLQNEPFAISSEFQWSPKDIQDEDIEEFAKLVVYNVEHGGSIDVPITDNVEIFGFSFVGNPGNAKSGGYEPTMLVRNEEEHLKNKEILEKVLAHLNQTEAEPVVEEKDETVEVDTEGVEAVEAPEQVEEEKVEEVKEDVLAKATETIETLQKENADKDAEIAELKAKIAEYEANEATVNTQLTQLEALLTKSKPAVEKATVKEEKMASTGLRKRFAGLA